MAEQLQIEIVTPERAVFEGTADEIVLPGSEGEVGVLPGHLPLLTSLGIGELVIRQDSQRRSFLVEGGFAEVLPDRVTILTEECQGHDEIDVAAAREALEKARAELLELEERASGETVEEDVMGRHRDALRRARLRLVFAGEEEED